MFIRWARDLMVSLAIGSLADSFCAGCLKTPSLQLPVTRSTDVSEAPSGDVEEVGVTSPHVLELDAADTGEPGFYPGIRCVFGPNCYECTDSPEGWVEVESGACPVDGYCDCADAVPQIICCNEPCGGEHGGLGIQGLAVPVTMINPGAGPPMRPGCKSIQIGLRSWTHGNEKSILQHAHLSLFGTDGALCAMDARERTSTAGRAVIRPSWWRSQRIADRLPIGRPEGPAGLRPIQRRPLPRQGRVVRYSLRLTLRLRGSGAQARRSTTTLAKAWSPSCVRLSQVRSTPSVLARTATLPWS